MTDEKKDDGRADSTDAASGDDGHSEARAVGSDGEKSGSAPAVHSDELWGGPRVIDEATGEPVLVTTKKEYFELLNQSGWRMKDQQESSTGPQREREAPVPPEFRPAPPVPALTQDEAQVFGAMTAIFKRYGIKESIWCSECFARNQSHGCHMVVSPELVMLRCRCGVAEYKPPTGTTDTVLSMLPNMSITALDKTLATIITPAGPEYRPTVVLNDMEALLIRRYVSILVARGKEPRWFHEGCYKGVPQLEDNALAMSVDSNDIIIFCDCRMLMHRSKRVEGDAKPESSTVH